MEWPADKFDTLGIFRIGALDAACRLVSIFSAWDLVTLVYVSGVIALSVALVSYVARGCILAVLSEHVPYRDWSHDC